MLAKRSVVEIVQEILQLEGQKKTDIMYKTALTYPQTIRYITALMERGLIEKSRDVRGREIYNITDKGRTLSSHIQIVIDYLGLGESNA